MVATQLTATPSRNTGIRQYLQLVESFPRLDEDEERALADRLKSDNDLEAARKLIVSHLRYVVYIARNYAGYGLPAEDLIQEGNIGLMKAVRRYDPSRGVRLVAYATYWIRAQIHEFILNNWRIVKVITTKAKRKLFYKLRGAKRHLDRLNRAEANNIATALAVSPDDVLEMDQLMYLRDESFDSGDSAPQDYLGESDATPDIQVTESEFLDTASEALTGAIRKLDARSRDIIESRWLADDDNRLTLRSLGERYSVSAERIRQLESEAIERLKEQLVPGVGVDHCEVGLPRRCGQIAC